MGKRKRWRHLSVSMGITINDTQDRAGFEDILTDLEAEHVHLGVFDADGVFRHKRVDAAKAAKLARNGYQFCDVLYNWDIAERPYGGGAFIDRPAFLDTASVRSYPFADCEAVCIADFALPFGERSARNQLSRLLDRAHGLGFTVNSAFEFEFMVLDETPESLRAKAFRDLDHFAAGNRTYSLQTAALHGDLLTGLEACMATLGIGLDSIHTELGPGCFEAPLQHAAGMRGADNAALFKSFAKAYFLRHGLMAAFLSKMGEAMPGQSGHLHISFSGAADGAPAFADTSAPDGLSTLARHFVGGLVTLMPELLALCSHTVNAYKRMVPGAWAPTYAAWGVQNRTAAVRVINDTAEATRIEFRVPSADTNPHAALAMCLGAGLWGIENEIAPPSPRDDDCYATPPDAGAAFPATLGEAAERLSASRAAREIFGDTYIDTVVQARRIEEGAYRRHVSTWELNRYLEVV